MRSFLTLLLVSVSVTLACSCGTPAGPTPISAVPLPDSQKAISPEYVKSLLASRRATGAAQFVDENPTYDGRGTIIAICDSGFDLGQPALQKTSDGRQKVIDIIDLTEENRFVTKTVIELAQRVDGSIPSAHGGRVHVGDIPAEQFRVGSIHEQKFIKTPPSDLNRDTEETRVGQTVEAYGKKTEIETDNWDIFDIVLAKITDDHGVIHWDCYIDTNDDGSVADEKPLRSYRERYDTFAFDAAGMITCCVNIEPDASGISLILPSDTHGAHVSGIAAGSPPKGKGLQGVAPGAQLILIKIGYNRFGGSSSTDYLFARAFQYAAEHGADVINLSYGGSSAPKDDLHLDTAYVGWITRQFGIVMTIAAGNNGPGIASINTPSAARYSVSIGSMITPENAKLNYGMTGLPKTKVVSSSSRGPVENGIAKPDLVAPGNAFQTMLRYNQGIGHASGTSMASPHAAGCFSLAISALKQKGLWHGPEATSRERFQNWRRLVQAFKASAQHLPDQIFLDEGAGLINLPGAVERFVANAKRPLGPEIEVSTRIPTYRRSRYGQGAYHRGVVPPTVEYVSLTPRLETLPTDEERADFLRTYRLVSDQPWVWPTSQRAGQKEAQDNRRLDLVPVPVSGGNFALRFDRKALTPGLHTANVYGYETDPDAYGSWNGPKALRVPAFRVPVVIVIGSPFSASDQYVQKYPNLTLRPNQLRRFFFDMPYGATGVQVTLRFPNAQFGTVYANLYSPRGDGRGHLWANPNNVEPPASGAQERVQLFRVESDDSGIWELCLGSGTDSEIPIELEMDVRVIGLHVNPSVMIKPHGSKAGDEFFFFVKNLYGLLFGLRFEAQIDRLDRSTPITVNGDRAVKSWVLPDWCSSLTVDFYREDNWENPPPDRAYRMINRDLTGRVSGRMYFKGLELIRENMDNTGPAIYTAVFDKIGQDDRLVTESFRPKPGVIPKESEPQWIAKDGETKYVYIERFELRHPIPVPVHATGQAFALRRHEEKSPAIVWPDLSAVNTVEADMAYGQLRIFRKNDLVAEVPIQIQLFPTKKSDNKIAQPILDRLIGLKKGKQANGEYRLTAAALVPLHDRSFRRTVIGTLRRLRAAVRSLEQDPPEGRDIEKALHFGIEPYGGDLDAIRKALHTVEQVEALIAGHVDLISDAGPARNKLNDAAAVFTVEDPLPVPTDLQPILATPSKKFMTAAQWLEAAKKLKDKAKRRQAFAALRKAKAESVSVKDQQLYRKRRNDLAARKWNSAADRYYHSMSEMFPNGDASLQTDKTFLDIQSLPSDAGISAVGLFPDADGKETVEELDLLIEAWVSKESPWTASDILKQIETFLETSLPTYREEGEKFSCSFRREGGKPHLRLTESKAKLTWKEARALIGQALQVHLDLQSLSDGAATYYFPTSATSRQLFVEVLTDHLASDLARSAGEEPLAGWVEEKPIFDFIRGLTVYGNHRRTGSALPVALALEYDADQVVLNQRVNEEESFLAWLSAAWGRDWTEPRDIRLNGLKEKVVAEEPDETEPVSDPESEGTDTEPSE